jgi:DNA-binding NtrC family response regulator
MDLLSFTPIFPLTAVLAMIDPGLQHSILVVDDEPTLRMAFSLALQNDATSVVEASDGADALTKLSAHPVELVLMDMRMPILGGLQAVEELRARGDHTPVVICSAHISVDDAVRAIRCGVVDFVSKPVELAHLRQVISDALDPADTAWASALTHARHMRFGAAVAAMEDSSPGTEQSVWLETFRCLAYPEQSPAGFFDEVAGRHRVEKLISH